MYNNFYLKINLSNHLTNLLKKKYVRKLFVKYLSYQVTNYKIWSTKIPGGGSSMSSTCNSKVSGLDAK